MMGSIEFRIPISPVRSMYSQVRLAALSLARLGAAHAAARIAVSVGDSASHEQVVAETPWARDFPIDWHVVPHGTCEANPIAASGNGRYAEGPRADLIVLCDADVCVVGKLDIDRALATPRPVVFGLQAHHPPFLNRSAQENDALWRRLLALASAEHYPLDHAYSLAPDGSCGRAPAYFNYGFVGFNRAAFLRIAPLVGKFSELAARFMVEVGEHPSFQSQLGLSLAIAAAKVDVVQLGHAYNCANDDRVLGSGLSVEDIRVIHYLRTEEFDRATFVCDRDAHRAFLATPLESRISERLRGHVRTLPEPLLPAR